MHDFKAGPVTASDVTTAEIPAHGQELTLSFQAGPGAQPADLLAELAQVLDEKGASLVHLMIYGAVSARDEVQAELERQLGRPTWPVTWVEGAGCAGQPLAGVQAWAVSGVKLQRLRLGERVVGTVYQDGDARHCWLGGLVPDDRQLAPARQAEEIFALMEHTLEGAGFSIADIARTWFYNDNILAWYDAFNRVRTAAYDGVVFRSGAAPASTGIGARNTHQAALEVAVWAVRPVAAAARIQPVASPLQCPAPAYGSTFSRAMEVASAGHRRLTISGTASITPDGRTAWVGDIDRQVELTMEVVRAMLHARGMDWWAVNRATAYFKEPRYLRAFDAWRQQHGLAALPCVPVHSVICRDDLLWEIEVDAVAGER